MSTYKFIASVSVGAGEAASITFSSIPNTYTDLLIWFSLRTSDNTLWYTDISVTLNSTNSSSGKVLYQYAGSSYAGYSPSSAQSFFASSVGNSSTLGSTFSNGQIYIPSYTSTYSKNLIAETTTENNTTNALSAMTTGGYTGVTSAVNTVTLTPTGSKNFSQYSTAYLYGISNA